MNASAVMVAGRVISRSDEITITPVGEQMQAAVANSDYEQFVWVGLNALLRYPLKGSPRPKPKGGEEQRNSNLLPYAFLMAALLDLDYLWRAELDHILCRVFTVESAIQAINDIKDLRAGRKQLSDFPIEENTKKGDFYNQINMVLFHLSMGFGLLNKDSQEAYLQGNSLNYKYSIEPVWRDLIEKALGGAALPGGCFVDNSFVSRMPSSLDFSSEQEYFNYLGAGVGTSSATPASFSTASLGGTLVPVLVEGKDYTLLDAITIRGTVEQFCQISAGQRVIVSHNTKRTFNVESKRRDSSHIILTLRPAKPLTLTPAISSILNES
ncbi:MAG: hypothetical protein EOO61_06785 [Hymenobacter sp.]|nr:MAG: hypothetical protein EOO61_06785 [Hymenobacter sp.]